jgi:cell division protein FtsQ
MPFRPRRDSTFLRQRRALRWRAFRIFCWRCAGWLLLALFLVAMHDVFVQWDRYNVHEIDIVGNRLIGREEVLDVTGLKGPINVFRVNPFLLAKRLQDDPRIKSADVSINWPDRIRIRIVERTPLAIIRMDPPVMIDVEGACFQASQKPSQISLPEIEGLTPADFPGSGTPAAEAYQETMNALAAWTKENVYLTLENIDRIRVDPDIGLTVIPKQAISGLNIGQIRIGYRLYSEKSALLEHVIRYMNQIHMNQAIEWIDLTDMKRIVLKPAGADSAEAFRKEK